MQAFDHRAYLESAFGDFGSFCGLLDIIPKGGKRAKFAFNNIQRIYCAERTQRDVILKPRRVGMTTLEQAKDVFHFLTVPGARVVLTCQSVADANPPEKALSKTFEVMFESLEKMGVRIDFRKRSEFEWTLADRDASLRIMRAGASESAAEKKGRAGTISRLHASEIGFYDYASDTMNALLECVPDVKHGSEIVFESTPNGASGYFYDFCQKSKAGENGYRFHFFPWCESEDHATEILPGEVVAPRNDAERGFVTSLVQRIGRRRVTGVTPEQLKWYQQKLATKSQSDMDQEYATDAQTCFLVSGRSFFDSTVTAALLLRAIDPLPITSIGLPKATAPPNASIEAVRKAIERDDLAVWVKPQPGVAYVVSADPSEGTGGDPGAAVVVERATGKHVATLHGQFQPWPMGSLLVDIAIWFNSALLVVERNNHGHAVLQSITQRGYTNLYIAADEKPGWNSTEISRSAALDAFENVHRSGVWTTPDARLIGELRTFIVNKNGKAEASGKAHDDLVMASAIANDVIRKAKVVTYDASYDDDLPQLRV